MIGINRFTRVTVAVKDQHEALQWFIRFVTVSPSKHPDLQVILASWFSEHVGKNPTAALYTDDCQATYDELRDRGVVFTEAPQHNPAALQAVFEDLYGNSCALLEAGASNG